MLTYCNTSVATRTFYGVTFKPGEIKSVPGYINDAKFVKVDAPTKEPPKKVDDTKASEPQKSKSNKEENKDGANSNQ